MTYTFDFTERDALHFTLFRILHTPVFKWTAACAHSGEDAIVDKGRTRQMPCTPFSMCSQRTKKPASFIFSS